MSTDDDQIMIHTKMIQFQRKGTQKEFLDALREEILARAKGDWDNVEIAAVRKGENYSHLKFLYLKNDEEVCTRSCRKKDLLAKFVSMVDLDHVYDLKHDAETELIESIIKLTDETNVRLHHMDASVAVSKDKIGRMKFWLCLNLWEPLK